jgi:uncharacterized protein (DUF169 family)
MAFPPNIKELLALRVSPIAIGAFSEPPPGVERYAGELVPSGCSFWEKAQSGLTFYTVPEDHLCAVGSYTHNLTPSAASALDLTATVEFMVENRYIEEKDVSTIPTLSMSPNVVAYGPVEARAFEPDVVMISADPSRAMLLFEASVRAGAGDPAATLLGRPTCAAVPQTADSGRSAFSLGCIGNRTYTGIPDGEMYVSVPGSSWGAVSEAVDELVNANASLEGYYRETLLTDS